MAGILLELQAHRRDGWARLTVSSISPLSMTPFIDISDPVRP